MNVLIVKGTSRVRLLPWLYEEPAVEVRMYGLRGTDGSCRLVEPGKIRSGTCPSVFGAPDPLWDMRRPRADDVMTWTFFIAPCFDPQTEEIKLVRMPLTVYRRIMQKIVGTPASGACPEDVLIALGELPGDMPLAEALAQADPPLENEWIEEPLDVTDLDDGCDIFLRRQGQGIETKYEVTFADPNPVQVKAVRKGAEKLNSSAFDVFEEAAEYVPPFDLELYLEACRLNQTLVTDSVRQRLGRAALYRMVRSVRRLLVR